jgi:hypothetical protein
MSASPLFTSTPTPVTVDAIRAALAKRSFASPASEDDLQVALARVFTEEGFAFQREAAIDARNRFDFLFETEGVVLETKIKGTSADLVRQIHRYAALAIVREIVVVTTKMQHRIDPLVAGKPVSVIWIGGGL